MHITGKTWFNEDRFLAFNLEENDKPETYT
jgi:hypothetical protein